MIRALYHLGAAHLFIQCILLFSVTPRLSAEAPATPAPEVFQAFAGGWLDFQDGHYVEAMRSFHDVALMDTRFSPAITGMKSCAEVLGLAQISDSLSVYEAAVNQRKKNYGEFTREFEPGVAFWGLYTDDENVNFSEIDELEKMLFDAIRQTTSLDVRQISPVSYQPEDRQQVKAYSYNILGLLSLEDGIVYLDLYLIRQFLVDTTQASGVGYEASQSIGYKQKRISLKKGELPQFFSSKEGQAFLEAMLTEGQAAAPGKFEPKYEPKQISEFDPKQSTVFDLIAAQANREPNPELILKFASKGSYDLNTKEPIIPYIYEGLVEWLIGHLNLTNPDLASLMSYYLEVTHIKARPEWGKISPEKLQAIASQYPNTPGGSLAELHFLIRRLTAKNINGSVGDQIEAHLERLEAHPLIGDRSMTMHHWKNRFFYSSTQQSLLLTFQNQRNLANGNYAKPKKLKRTLPLFGHISLTYDHRRQDFQLISQVYFPAAMIEQKSDEGTQAEILYMLQFHSDYLNGEINAEEVLRALAEDTHQSIYLTLLASYCSKVQDNLQLRLKALKRILQEFEAPENERISFQLLVKEAKILKRKLPDDRAFEDLKTSVDTAILTASKNPEWTGNSNLSIRTLVSTFGDAAAQSEDALNDLEQQVFEVADNADIEKAGWIYQLHWYLKWLIRHKEIERIRTTLARYETRFQKTIPPAKGGSPAFDWQVRLPMIIAEQYIHVDQLEDAQRWLQPLTSYDGIQLRMNGSASERLAEQALIQSRIYLAAIHLNKTEYEQAAQYVDNIIEQHTIIEAAPISKDTILKICPDLQNNDISNTTEAALAIKEHIANAPKP